MKKLIALLFLQCLFTQLSKAQSCVNWLHTQVVGQSVTVGDLDITGTQLTVEGNFNCTAFPVGTGNIWEEIVSKHSTPSDCNYALRMNMGAITTTNGFFRTPPSCDNILLNKMYHAAMVYDGSTLKFYRDGFLMSQIAATGNLILNDLLTTIGDYAYNNPVGTNFVGYLNEIRIWNVARTQAQIQAYMNASLPTPTTQAGLVAYYTFNNLLNKQGNALWNGTINGAATINATNPNCTFVADSCYVLSQISNIINDYTPVLGADICKNILTVQDAGKYNAGDTVLLIQMKGAVIDSTNTAAFGTITNYKNAGNYEFNYVKSKTGNDIELLNNITRGYDIPNGKVQLIRVPYYQSANISSELTCSPWDGNKGGVLVFNVRDTLNMNADINTTGKGFLKGTMHNSNVNTFTCDVTDYYYPDNTPRAAGKGEGITALSTARNSGKGPAANGGGGGMDANTGGGGGSNGNKGGRGGYEYNGGCPNYLTAQNWGYPGNTINYSTAANTIFMGGAGGAGHCNNQFSDPTVNADYNGGNGGGLIIINSNYIAGNNKKIISKGDNAYETNVTNSYVSHDGMGGGGAGGTVLLNNNNYIGNLTVNVSGGKGGDMQSMPSGGLVGPGGGGGGGVVWVKQNATPAALSIINTGGLGGVIVQNGNNPYGAEPGLPGINVFNVSVPIDNTPFKKNIDSVRFNFTGGSCTSSNLNFFGLAYINGIPITNWHWDFGDGGIDNVQNASHAYSAVGTYTVKLVATDNNGCKDSVLRAVIVNNTASFDFTYKQDVCNPLSVQFASAGTLTANPYWSFGDAGTSTGTLAPAHTYAAPGNYLVRFTVNNAPCNDTISKMITINVAPADIVITPDTTICFGATKQLRAQPSASFCWTPTAYLNNPNTATPITSTPKNITYYYTSEVTGTNLIVNGDFTAGNSGFTTSYVYAANNTVEGEYFVGPNPVAWNGGTAACKDHTTGAGNMMMVNGAPTPGTNVWKETVPVTPNTNYSFSCWVQSVSVPNPAQLQFSINNILTGPVFSPGATTCNWQQFFSNWNSGINTSATISIVNLNTLAGGNDFALDDISFAPVSIKRDSVKIIVDTPKIAALGSASICAGLSTQLNATGGSTYSWTPATSLSNASIVNPIATPGTTTTYTVTGTTVNGCSAQAPVTVTVLPKPVITKTNDTTICKSTSVQLQATGGTTYSWTPAASLSNPNIANPVATPTAAVTKYYVTVTNNPVNACKSTDSVKVTIKADPVFTVSPAQATCQGIAAQLNASGGDIFLWSPAALVSNASIANPLTATSATTNYSVTITESVCNISKTLSTLITVNPAPQVTATRSNDIDCSFDFSNLLATGAQQYTWAPVTGLSNSTIYNPISKPTTTTQYIVTGTNAYGCTDTGKVTVAVTTIGASLYSMPNTFTPNGDGKNDCFGIKYWGIVEQLEFSIFNRYGERVFYTTDPYQCWNGLYKTDKPLPGNYVYYIKAKTACGQVEKKGNVLLIR